MPERPNIVLILVDDMGYGDFSAFNGGQSRTPTLDQLLTESVCFTQHYAASPVCNPSRAALLTGRYPHRTGSIDTLEWRGLERLALREVTLADVLSGAGYATGLIGKWHLGAFDPRYHPERRGFGESLCFRGGMHDYYQWRLECGDSVRRADGRYLTDVWTEAAVDFLARHRAEQPFFLHVTYNAPHTPLQCPAAEVAPFVETGRFTEAVSTLYGMLRRMDRGVEQILAALERYGLSENTLVIFTSDNGPQFGSTAQGELKRFNCGFNGSKGTCYEGGIRVPLLARWPGGFDGGREVSEMSHLTDWFPTLLAAAGCEPPSGHVIDGVNILPVLRGEQGQVCTRRFWQWNRYTPLVTCNAAMRDGEWKLVRPVIGEAMAVPDIEWLRVSMYEPERLVEGGIIRGPDPPRHVPAPPPPLLFNIAADPLEQHDLAESEPGRVSRMLGELERWFAEVDAERQTIDDVP